MARQSFMTGVVRLSREFERQAAVRQRELARQEREFQREQVLWERQQLVAEKEAKRLYIEDQIGVCRPERAWARC